MRKLFFSLSAFLVFLLPVAAHADILNYAFTGDYTGGFNVDTTVAPTRSSANSFFNATISNTTGSFAGLSSITFENFSQDLAGSGVYLNGPKLYSGAESTPTYLTGRFSLTSLNNLPVSLNVTNTSALPVVSSTPEPSSLILLGTGVLGTLGAARRRFKA